MIDKPCTELPNPEAAVLPALVSVFNSEVTLLGHFIHSAFADKNEQWPGPRGYVLPSDKPYFLAMLAWPISPYETRSSGYQPHTDFHGSAPSPQNLTGKRSLTYSIAPFMVELFTFGVLVRYPRLSAPVLPVARQQLPTPAALNELS